ncbi:IS110 family RNA-guided transposase [Actinomycetospora lemnae]|uniref:IS110 family transposase n=1 Tax=Actinomycetospora lemnae TaxID=3019891 RepID=A0ABT5SRM0_9PSEU|nr:IS110 family transposase [Actinomycetospora sp. DW7H6]MDD7965501.1 IS110 family transposase [Actinomycetospora sp. DW7H6]
MPATNAVLGIDLADRKQAAALTDHDSRVLARRRAVCRAWELGPVLDWAVEQAQAAGFSSVTVACEATGHRWQVLEKLAAERGLNMVCVQSLLVWRAREGEDLTWDKSDPKDAMLIARLTTQLRCYEPETSDGTWSRLRQLGARRRRLLTESTACGQQLRDLLECVWPAALEAAKRPLESASWCAAIAVVLARAGDGDLSAVRRMGQARFVAAVGHELSAWGSTRSCRRIVEAVFAATDDAVGLVAHRRGTLERAGFVIADWREVHARRTEVETRMLGVLDELELTELVGSIPGVSVLGAAAVLAECGNPARFPTPRALVKHAGLCPREDSSGEHRGHSRLSGRGRPELRTAAWRATWGAQHANPVLRARHEHLTTREHNRLAGMQARAACAATLLRWLHVVVVRRVPWDPDVAAGRRPQPVAVAAGACVGAPPEKVISAA